MLWQIFFLRDLACQISPGADVVPLLHARLPRQRCRFSPSGSPRAQEFDICTCCSWKTGVESRMCWCACMVQNSSHVGTLRTLAMSDYDLEGSWSEVSSNWWEDNQQRR